MAKLTKKDFVAQIEQLLAQQSIVSQSEVLKLINSNLRGLEYIPLDQITSSSDEKVQNSEAKNPPATKKKTSKAKKPPATKKKTSKAKKPPATKKETAANSVPKEKKSTKDLGHDLTLPKDAKWGLKPLNDIEKNVDFETIIKAAKIINDEKKNISKRTAHAVKIQGLILLPSTELYLKTFELLGYQKKDLPWFCGSWRSNTFFLYHKVGKLLDLRK